MLDPVFPQVSRKMIRKRFFWRPQAWIEPRITINDTVYDVLVREAEQSLHDNFERVAILIGKESVSGHLVVEAILDHGTCERWRIFLLRSPFFSQYNLQRIGRMLKNLGFGLQERILAHTHAGDGAVPSALDRDNSDYQREVGVCVDLGSDGQLEATGYMGEYCIPVYYRDRSLSPRQDSRVN